MNIPTENIDEWCFRYLEKDLNAEECAFFENELQKDLSLAKQLSLWNKTVISTESLTPVEYVIPTNLFRYRNQFLSVFFEFVLIGSISFFLLHYTAKETASIEPANTTTAASSSSCILYKDSASTDHGHSNKSSYTNLILNDINDSVAVFQNNEPTRFEVDSAMKSSDYTLPTLKEVTRTDSIKTNADSTSIQKESVQKKNTTRRKYRGSRLIPINNDL